VTYNGILTSGDEYFTVTKEDDNVFNIKFKTPYQNGKTPTVLIFPSWTRVGYLEDDEEENDGSRPRDIISVNFGLKTFNPSSFEISNNVLSSDEPYLGFNFLVIGQDMPTENVKHGFVTKCSTRENNLNQFLLGATVDDCPDITTFSVRDKHAGVKIIFDQPFKDIPSVVATPYYNVEVIADKIIPRCVVETITTEFVRIKCGAIINDTDYQPIPFMFLAVGIKSSEIFIDE